MRDIGRYRPLTAEEEHNLALRARQGDMQARRQLIEANMLLVVNIAQQYIRPDTELMDMIQEGNLGLMHAVELFDPKMGSRLSTVAYYWIHKQIQRFLEKTNNDLASLDQEVVSAGELVRVSDTIEDKATILGDQTFPATDACVMQDNSTAELIQQYELLPRRERKVIQLLYGIQLRRSYSVTKVASLLGISKARVCHLHASALKRLRNRRKLISPYDPL